MINSTPAFVDHVSKSEQEHGNPSPMQPTRLRLKLLNVCEQEEEVSSDSLAKCNSFDRSFPSRKALCGHMRMHPKTEVTDHEAYDGRDDDQAVNAAYTLVHMLTGIDLSKREYAEDANVLSNAELGVQKNCDATVEACNMKVKGSFVCDICNKSFNTHQALGGHITSHHRTKFQGGGEGSKRVGRKRGEKEHRCKICGKVFSIGQSLGGHMRAHYNKNLDCSPSQTIEKDTSIDIVISSKAKASVTEEADTVDTCEGFAETSSESVSKEIGKSIDLDLNEPAEYGNTNV